MTDSPFDYLNSILSTKKYLMENDQNEKDYPPFFINRGLSQHVDCILFANEMNMNGHLDHRLQYDYLFHSIRKMKRTFGKWAKRKDNEAIQAVSQYYEVNLRRAKEYVAILSKEQRKFIMKTMEEVNG